MAILKDVVEFWLSPRYNLGSEDIIMISKPRTYYQANDFCIVSLLFTKIEATEIMGIGKNKKNLQAKMSLISQISKVSYNCLTKMQQKTWDALFGNQIYC